MKGWKGNLVWMGEPLQRGNKYAVIPRKLVDTSGGTLADHYRSGQESWILDKIAPTGLSAPPTQASILTILAKKARENEGSHTQKSSFLKTFSPHLLKKEPSPMGEMGIGAQEKNTL